MLNLVGIWVIVLAATVLQVAPSSGELKRVELVHDGWERVYWVFEPQGYDADQGGQALLVLHGGGMQPSDMMAVTRQGFDALMADYQGIVVYPAGVGAQWNDGRVRDSGLAYTENVDDVGFLTTVIDDLATGYGIDPAHVYLTGFSNGAGMAYRFACEASDRVAALATVAGLLASTQACQPDAPVAIMTIIGAVDPLIPLSGGDLSFEGQSLGAVYSLVDTLAIWFGVNGCQDHVASDDAVDLAGDDDVLMLVDGFSGCETPLNAYIVRGGGHTWPGSPVESDPALFGPTILNLDATGIIFDFLLENGLAIG